MTERPKWDAGPGEHPDEGTIHAWLDGALDPESAERVAAHVRGCSACSALAAEARGLIAGASRVVSALDDVPAGIRPGWAQGDATEAEATGAPVDRVGEERSLWRRLRVTPARAAIAATILVALGVTLTHDRVAMESVRPMTTLPAGHSEPRTVAATPPAGTPAAAGQKDRLLDSAVARNLSIAQGSPSLEAAREPAIPKAPPPSTAQVGDAPVAVDEQRVAAGRAAVRAQRDTAGVAADRLRVGGESGDMQSRGPMAIASTPARQEMRKAGPGSSGTAAGMALPYADVGARSCFSLEGQQEGATWGDQPLPLVVVVDSGPAVGTRSALVRSAATRTAMRAAWVRSGNDSVLITLQHVGLDGTIALGPDAGGRAGLASSGAIVSSHEEVAAKRADAPAGARAKSVSPSAAANVAAVRVTLRPMPCPAR